MNSGVESIDKIAVADLFQDSYVVPIYQRPFAWEQEQIDRLLEDIKETEGNYYLGLLVVDEKDGESKKKFEVIDGQQRLTTLFLIESYLNQYGSDYHIENSLLYEAREKYRDALLHPDKSQPDAPEINKAYEIIDSYFKKPDDKGEKPSVDDFKNKIREHIFIVRVQVPKGVDLNHYFEIMNTRGEQLELHQIAKAKILQQIEKKDEKFIASIIWDSCSDMNSYVQMNFGTSLRVALFGEKWNELIEDEKIFSVSTSENLSGSDFQKLGEIIKKPSAKEKNKPSNNENRKEFEPVISFSNFLLQVNLIRKYGDNSNNLGNNQEIEQDSEDSSLDDSKLLEKLGYLWSAGTKELRDKAAKEFIIKMLRCRLLFDRYILKRDYSSVPEGKWSLQKLKEENGKAVYVSSIEGEDNTLLRTLQSALRITYTSPKSMRWINVVLEHVYNNGTGSELINKLEKYCRKKVIESKYEEKRGFDIGRIVFSYLDYLLYRDGYSYSFDDGRCISLEKRPQSWEFQFRISIEHFFPQNPNSTEISQKRVEDWKKDDMLNDFGNLALVTVESNSMFSNTPPESKSRRAFVEQSLKLKIMAEITKLKGTMLNTKSEAWTPTIAESHGDQMRAILREDIKKSFPNVVEQKLEQPNEANALASNNSQADPTT